MPPFRLAPGNTNETTVPADGWKWDVVSLAGPLRHDVRGEFIGVKGARDRPEDPVQEAASLVGQEPWHSTTAHLFEGHAVIVLLSPMRCRLPGTSDIQVTLLVKRRCGMLGSVAITMARHRSSYYGKLDAGGQCLIRDVPDGLYQLGLSRVPELGHPDDAPILPVPAECLGDSPCWTSGDGQVTATRLSEDWRTVQLEADTADVGSGLQVGRVVDGRLELRSVDLGRPQGAERLAATLEFEPLGSPTLVCLPLPDTRP
jgi:hypothetical protein